MKYNSLFVITGTPITTIVGFHAAKRWLTHLQIKKKKKDKKLGFAVLLRHSK